MTKCRRQLGVAEDEVEAPARRSYCNGRQFPAVKLAFEKVRCVRRVGTEVLNTPDQIADYARKLYGCKPQEHFAVFSLSAQNQIINVHEVAMGGFSAAPVDIAVVFAGAMLSAARAIIIVHNHPSGVPTASQADRELTRQIARVGRDLGIPLLDHLIVTPDPNFFSFASSDPSAIRV